MEGVVRSTSAQFFAGLLRLPWLTLGLLKRFWPQLMVLWLLGIICNTLLTELAVMIGRLNALAGLSTLALVVLAKLVVIVAMFETVRPGLPALDAASRGSADGPAPGAAKDVEAKGFVAALTFTLVPFFAFYAAWGFLGDTVREYSKLSLDLMMFGEGTNLLDVSGGAWLFFSVAAAWGIRRLAKFMHKRSKAPVWPVVIVICEANWAFIGLFVLANWESEVRMWVGQLPARISAFFSLVDPIGDAAAARIFPPPPETDPAPFLDGVTGLFFYALYPLVWMTLAALIYGYDINGDRPVAGGRVAGAIARWQALPEAVRDFILHFIEGTMKRYRALAEGVGLAMSSGLGLALATIVLYRMLDWGSAWAWYGSTQIIGPHELPLWQIIAQAISLLLGSPSAPGDGALIMPIKVCLLAAALEVGFAQGRSWHRATR